MKFQLFNLLTFCLATSGFLAPAQAASVQSGSLPINIGEAERLVCVKEAAHLVCNVEKSGQHQSGSNQAAAKSEQTTQSLKSSNAIVVPQLLNPQEQKSTANILLWLSYLLPCGLVLGIFLADSCCAYRSNMIKQQIELLEKLWQSGSDNDATTDSERGARG